MILNRIFTFFEERVDPYPDTNGQIPTNSFISFLLFSVKGVKRWLLGFVILGIFLGIFEAYLFQMMGWLVDALHKGNLETFWQDHYRVLTAFVVIIALSIVFTFLKGLLQFQTLIGVFPMRLRWWFHHMLMQQSIRFFQDELAGRISSKVMQTALAVREVVFSFAEIGVYVVVYFATAGVILSGFAPEFLIPFGVWLLLLAVMMYFIVPKIAKVTASQADARSVMVGRVTDTYANIQTVKLFSQHKNESKYAKEAMCDFLETVHQQMRLLNILDVVMHTVNMSLLLAVSIMGIVFWRHSLVSVGAVSTAIAFALRLNNMSFWIMFELARLFENVGVVKDGMNTFSLQPEVVDKPEAKALVVTEGQVRYQDISFSYSRDKPIFSHFDLNIEKGEKVGLVGFSGSGKSTLINLLLRFYDLDSGVISIDGQDISEVTQESLRASIGMVTQDTSLLHRSVRDNICYGMVHATEEEIIRAARQAKADDFIDDLTDKYGHKGYDTLVGERGVKLSGGQRQRISIARVLLKNAPILILDEATSALDSEVESAIQDTLKELMQNKTVIAIAHRLSTIAAMDRLVVLDKGQIIEMGSHQELLVKDGLYAQLWRRQSGGFLQVRIG